MPNRTAKFASALIAGVLASAALATVSHGATPAADNCLSSPKDGAPQGSHWYYRIEHPSNRHCWYLRGAHDAATQSAAPTASADPPASANPAPPTTATAMPGSVANARAELPSPQTRNDQGTNAAAGQLPAAAARVDNAPAATLTDANMLRSVVASRWPEQLAAASPDVSDASPDNSVDNTPSDPVATQPSTVATVPLASADASSEKQSGSTQMLIIAIVGALSVAGLAASAVGYGGRRKLRFDEIHDGFKDGFTDDFGADTNGETKGRRRAIWETTLTDRPLPSPFPAPVARRPNIGIPNELREAHDPDDKIAAMLARLARSAQA
jgi:hypothetical protein